MRKSIRIFLFALLCAASYSACQRATEEKEAEKTDSLRLAYESLSDSVEVRWAILAEEEQEKLDNMKQVLEELSREPVYNQARWDSLYEHLQLLYDMQLEPTNLSSEKIDRYDSAYNSLKGEIIDYTNNHPDVEEFPLVYSLIDTIEAADQRVLFHRVRYDNYVKDFNHWLEGHLEYVRQIDTTGLPQERETFQLPE